MKFGSLSLAIAVALVSSACEAPIPGREQIEADAAWTAGEWTAEDGTVWRVRINGRRINATAEAGPGQGRILRGSIQTGILHYTVEANDGTDLFSAGEARMGDATHAVFHDDPKAGDAGPHGVWHVNHKPSAAGAAPAIAPTSSPVAATPSSTVTSAPTVAAPTEAPTPEAGTPTSPTPSASPSATPSNSPAAPGVIDLLPPR